MDAIKKLHKILIIICLIVSTISPVSAHTGKTDSNGGHTDHSTGDYHYHHGYPAHAHYDKDGDGIIDCPYNYDDQTNHDPGSTSSSSDSLTLSKVAYDEGYADGYDKGHEDGYASGEANALAQYKKQLSQMQAENEESLQSAKQLTVFLTLLALSPIFFLVYRSGSKKVKKLEANYKFQKLSLESDYKKEIHSLESAYRAEIDYLQKQLKKEKRLSLLEAIASGKDSSIQLPSDISLKQSYTPIKGKIQPNYPYGEYTVYISGLSKTYHCRHKCVSSAKPMHFFDLPSDARPCMRCVRKDMYPKPLPDWYIEIRKKLNEES